MNDVAITALLIVSLFALLGSSVWIGLTLAGVAWIGMELFSSRPAGDAMAVTVWGSSSSWTLTALPIPKWWVSILIPYGFLSAALHFLRALGRASGETLSIGAGS